MKRNYTYYSKLIKRIELTRSKNNRNWMDLIRVGFKHNPKETKKILREIFKEDNKVNSLVKKLIK